MFIVSVIVQSNYHIMQFLHQMFNVFALLLDDACKPSAEGDPKQRQVCSGAPSCCRVYE